MNGTRITRWLYAIDEMDNLCASAENMWLQFNSQMSPEDKAARSKVIAEARNNIDDFINAKEIA